MEIFALTVLCNYTSHRRATKLLPTFDNDKLSTVHKRIQFYSHLHKMFMDDTIAISAQIRLTKSTTTIAKLATVTLYLLCGQFAICASTLEIVQIR